MKTLTASQNWSNTSDINRYDNGWRLAVNFSDNPYMMYKYSDDIIELQKTRSILDGRILRFVRREINNIRTSDLGFTYIKKSLI